MTAVPACPSLAATVVALWPARNSSVDVTCRRSWKRSGQSSLMSDRRLTRVRQKTHDWATGWKGCSRGPRSVRRTVVAGPGEIRARQVRAGVLGMAQVSVLEISTG
jgi:hypothetical protein